MMREKDQLTIVDHEQEIRASLDTGFPFLKFPQAIEAFFNEHDWEKRRHRYVLLGICATLIYDLYCIGDKIMLPDIYRSAWAIRLFVVTPVMLATLLLIGFKRLKAYQEALASFQLLLVTLGLIWILALSRHPNVEHYYTGILVIVMFGNIAVRLRFIYALLVSLAIFVIYVFFSRNFITMSMDTVHNSSLILLTTMVLSLVANYQIEKESRREYLLTVLQGIDAHRLNEANKKLELLSISDGLTGLANRRFFDETLSIEWKAAARGRYSVSLLFLDIDSFKPYNDNNGHQAGDVCLISVAQVIRGSINRPRDLAARYGGEEFVVLLPQTHIHDATRLAETIRRKVEALDIEHRFSETAPRVTVSLGVASTCPGPDTSPETLLQWADSAMYEAKSKGRNRVRRYDESNQA